MLLELAEYLNRIVGRPAALDIAQAIANRYPQVNNHTHCTFGLELRQPTFTVPILQYGITLNLEVEFAAHNSLDAHYVQRVICYAYEPVSDTLFISAY